MADTTEFKEVIRKDPNAAEALWDCVTTDPTAGVAVIRRDLRVLYMNRRSAMDFGGMNARPEDFVGRSLEACGMDPAYVEDRWSHCTAVLKEGRPRLLRSIWRGWQYLIWYTPMGGTETSGHDCVLMVGRRHPGIGLATAMQGPAVDVIYIDRVELGPLNVLTTRELEVLALIGAGHSIKEAAALLHRSPKTVEKHRLAAGRKLGLSDRAELIEMAHRAGLMREDAARPRVGLNDDRFARGAADPVSHA